MNNFPKIFIELWEATQKIADKLIGFVNKAAGFIWGIFVWLFEKFVDLFQYIADKL